MSCRKYLMIAVLFSVAVFLSATDMTPSLFAQSGRSTGSVVLPFPIIDSERPLVRGQDEPAERKGPSFLDRLKKTLANITKDKDDDSPDAPVRDKDRANDPLPRPQSIPTTPPKPVTSQELRQAVDNPEPVVEKRPAPTQSPPKTAESVRDNNGRENPAETPRTPQAVGSSANESIGQRMAKMREIRESFFESVPENHVPTTTPPLVASNPTAPSVRPPLQQNAFPTLQTDSLSMSDDFPRRPTISQQLADETGRQPSFTSTPSRPIAMSTEAVPETWETDDPEPISTPSGLVGGMKPLSGVDVPKSGPSWNPGASRPNPTRQPVETTEFPTDARAKMMSQELPQRNSATFPSEREKSLLVGPIIELETAGSSKAIVGQESTYQIRVMNRGGAPAEQVVLTVEIPNWIDVLQPEMSAGTTSIVPRPNSDILEFVWKIAKVDAKTKEELVLHLIPRQRETVDLKIRYDFRKPLAVAKIVVQEPTLEMDLQGPSEVLWGSKVSYKLRVRNTGNGDAENVKLELLQTGSDMQSCVLSILEAGKEQIIDVEVWTGKQDHVDINIQATGPYDLTATAMKRITVLRPELNVLVEAPEMLFVGNPAEYTVRVRNVGNATAKGVELAATIPLGAKHVSNSGGGRLTLQNQVIWNVEAIPGGGEFVTTVVCEMKREGNCKLEASANDKSGLLASGFGSVNVEAITDLKMQLENPQGPVEVGQEAVFVIQVSNRGTKTAEDVEVIASFAQGIEPFAIEGGNGTMSDGQVFFDKIPAISAGQTLTLKVKGRADRPGNHRVRAEVICQAANAHLVYEQATYFFPKQKGKTAFMAESPNNTGISSFEQPATPLSLQHTTTSQPLQNAPNTATKTLPPLR